LLSTSDIRGLFSRYGVPCGYAEADSILQQDRGYAEPLLRALGAEVADSMDASEFEGASVVHDMNQPVPEAMKGRYTLVYDGGCLEHVFNYPRALQNCMELLEVGGTLLLLTPCNNYMGHGFYQFSPELFFRALGEENGFAVEAMYMRTLFKRDAPWFLVSDPARLGKRVEATTWESMILFVRARRVREVPIFARAPQQSDYSRAWNQGREARERARPALFQAARRGRLSLLLEALLPRELWRRLRDCRDLYRMRDRLDPEMFRAVELD
jgi:hypothetical protein